MIGSNNLTVATRIRSFTQNPQDELKLWALLSRKTVEGALSPQSDPLGDDSLCAMRKRLDAPTATGDRPNAGWTA